MEASEADSFCCDRFFFFPYLWPLYSESKRRVIQPKAQWACWELKYSVLLRCWASSWTENTCQPPSCTLQVHLQSVQLTQLTKNQPAQAGTISSYRPEFPRCAFTYTLVSSLCSDEPQMLLSISTPEISVIWRVEQRNHTGHPEQGHSAILIQFLSTDAQSTDLWFGNACKRCIKVWLP